MKRKTGLANSYVMLNYDRTCKMLTTTSVVVGYIANSQVYNIVYEVMESDLSVFDITEENLNITTE
jgi:hypothetical protein